MNTAAVILKKIDLLSFVSQSTSSGATLRMASSHDGSQAGFISFPSCGNWTNKPSLQSPRRAVAGSFFRSLLAR